MEFFINPPLKKKNYLAVNPCSYLKFKSIYGTLCLLSLELDHDIGMYFGKKSPYKMKSTFMGKKHRALRISSEAAASL